MPAIEFWYEFASTYFYPAAMRIEEVAGAKGVVVRADGFPIAPEIMAEALNELRLPLRSLGD